MTLQEEGTVEPLSPENKDTSVLRTLCCDLNMFSHYKFAPEMRTPLYTGHYIQSPRCPQ